MTLAEKIRDFLHLDPRNRELLHVFLETGGVDPDGDLEDEMKEERQIEKEIAFGDFQAAENQQSREKSLEQIIPVGVFQVLGLLSEVANTVLTTTNFSLDVTQDPDLEDDAALIGGRLGLERFLALVEALDMEVTVFEVQEAIENAAIDSCGDEVNDNIQDGIAMNMTFGPVFDAAVDAVQACNITITPPIPDGIIPDAPMMAFAERTILDIGQCIFVLGERENCTVNLSGFAPFPV
ncbi:unnamed protein product [Chrysoparadoxa australica]